MNTLEDLWQRWEPSNNLQLTSNVIIVLSNSSLILSLAMTAACTVCAACVTYLALLPSEPLWAVTYHQVHTLSARPTVLTIIDHTGLEVWRDQLSLCANEQCIRLPTYFCTCMTPSWMLMRQVEVLLTVLCSLPCSEHVSPKYPGAQLHVLLATQTPVPLAHGGLQTTARVRGRACTVALRLIAWSACM